MSHIYNTPSRLLGIVTISAISLIASTLSVSAGADTLERAGRHSSDQVREHIKASRQALLDAALTVASETEADTLQANQDRITALRTQLKALRSADAPDAGTISDVRTQLRTVARSQKALLSGLVKEVRDTAKDELLTAAIAAASTDQAATLEANNRQIVALRSRLSELRDESTVDYGTITAVKTELRQLSRTTKEIIEILSGANDEVQSKLDELTIALPVNPRRRFRHYRHGRRDGDRRNHTGRDKDADEDDEDEDDDDGQRPLSI